MSTTPDKCPHCGAAHIGVNYWCCGSDPFFQSDRCKERAELAATKRELEKAEARVRELEGLVVTDASFRYLLPEITVRVPAGAVGRNPKTLGEAMPQQKGGQS